ncbi:hypothetical protein FYK55_23640 [Roseiconus nitratireducens]|uniref:Uncharacterized protein n=1 Tax=Roseiconus nitratireducens TaxID=2605748 RepID=A0A5M6CWH8_9BACT|nr:dockerin type I domain-containing protein [Roseiconus nitratireducens]KAA5539571.1 hypothetical protein FYK55_23640 [Roseiconus nitratireducens]
MSFRFRPQVERLEARRLLATLTVTGAEDVVADDGVLTLREALLAANSNTSIDDSPAGDPGTDEIRFDAALAGTTIKLTSGELRVNESVEIRGLGADKLVIDAEQNSRVFRFGDALAAQWFIVAGLTLQNGVAPQESGTDTNTFGGAVHFNSLNRSRLQIIDCVIQGSQATVGGGMHLRNTVAHIDGTTFTGNSASFGGGISVQESNLAITNSTITNNVASTAGGGIDHFKHEPVQDSTVDLVHVTLMDNEAPMGRNARNGAKAGKAVFRFANSIIFGGPGSGSEMLRDSVGGTAVATSLGGNLTDHGVSTDVLTTEDRRVLSFEGNVATLQDNGGPVPTRALHPLDFAVDLGRQEVSIGPGEDLLIGTADDQILPHDQRGAGFDRQIDGGSGESTPDAGAFEIQDGLDIPETLVVSNTADILFRGDGPDVNDLTLREAIHLSNLKLGANTIEFDESLTGQTIVLTTGRTLFVYDELDLIGPGADKLTIDGDQQNRQFVFQANEDVGLTFTIDGLTLTGGKAPSGGGAIFAWRNHLVIKNTHFENNESTFAGGAIFARNMVLDVVNSSFVGNASPGNGGVLNNLNSDVTLTGVTAIGNSAAESAGAVHMRVSNPDVVRTTRIQNSTFFDNQAPVGADLLIRPDAGLEGKIQFVNSIFASQISGVQTIDNVLPDPTITRLESLGSNIIIDDSAAGLDRSDLNSTDPRFGGTIVGTGGVVSIATLADSPALDAADESALPLDTFDVDADGDIAERLPLDGIGGLRSVDLPEVDSSAGPSDIGAFEMQRDIVLSSANGKLGLLLDQDNVVITADNEILLSSNSADVDSITVLGTHADEDLVVADFSGFDPSGTRDSIPVTVDGGPGIDSLTFSSTYTDFLSSRIVTANLNAASLDTEFAHGTRLTSAVVAAALNAQPPVMDWHVEHPNGLSESDPWLYVGHVLEGQTLYRKIEADGVEVRIDQPESWTNPLNPVDVNPDGIVGALDALIVINAIARGVYYDSDTLELGDPASFGSIPDHFYDVNRDGRLTPIDALNVINYLARQPLESEGEPGNNLGAILHRVTPDDVDHVFAEYDPPLLF